MGGWDRSCRSVKFWSAMLNAGNWKHRLRFWRALLYLEFVGSYALKCLGSSAFILVFILVPMLIRCCHVLALARGKVVPLGAVICIELIVRGWGAYEWGIWKVTPFRRGMGLQNYFCLTWITSSGRQGLQNNDMIYGHTRDISSPSTINL